MPARLRLVRRKFPTSLFFRLQKGTKKTALIGCLQWSGKRDSNSRPRPWQGRALPTELFPHSSHLPVKRRRLELPRHNCHYPLKVARLPIPPSLRQQKEVTLRLCPEQDSNLHVSQHSHLKRARLPFRHLGIQVFLLFHHERKTRLELATPTLARSCSTN